jgi:hypothetical protein
MTLSARFSLLHSDLSDFLFASLGDEPNGMPLSVISALTRLGVDPWEEAARLAALPKDPAAEALAPMLARLPIGRSDEMAVAHQLVKLLPMHGRAVQSGRELVTGQRWLRTMLVLAFIAWGAAILFVSF